MIAVIFIVSPVEKALSKEGFYLGGNILYNNIDGDFDGINGPEADPGLGIGLIAGYAFIPSFAFQINWNASVHDSALFTGAIPSDGGFGAFILGLKYNFLSDQTLQPFIRGGWGGFAFTIKDPIVGDVDLTGTGFDLGLGLDYYANPHFSIGGGVSRRFIKYDEIEMQGTKEGLSPKVNGDTTSLDISFVYHF